MVKIIPNCIKIATWNNSEDDLANTLKEEKINIAAVSETSKIGTGSEENFGTEYKMYSHGKLNNEDCYGEVAIVLDSVWADLILGDPIYKNCRMMSIKLDSKSLGWKKNIMVIAINAPNELNQYRNETNEFYKDLETFIQDEYAIQKQSYYLVLLGNFHARISKGERLSVAGKFKYFTKMNYNGGELIKLVNKFNLKITNTYFEDKIHNTESLVDYIIVDEDCFESVQLTKSWKRIDIMINFTMADHYLVSSIIEEKQKNVVTDAVTGDLIDVVTDVRDNVNYSSHKIFAIVAILAACFFASLISR